MKKVYLGLLGFAMAGSVVAQQPRTESPAQEYGLREAAPVERVEKPVQSGQRDVLWSEDFADGFDGPNGTWTTAGANGDIWEYTTQIQAACWSGGADAAAQMSTRENGFMLFHADDFNCINPGPPQQFNQDPLAGELISPSIDLSDQPAVLLSFEHWFRHCCSAMFEVWVSVSNDGGATWTDYNVTGNTPANDYNENNLHSVNISAAAANQSDVLIKFVWNATGSSSHYFWAIDDITLEIPPDDDMALEGTPVYSIHDPTEDMWDNLEYSVYDINQVRPLVFSASASNVGATEQTGVFLEVVVSDGAGYETTLTSGSLNMPVGEIATFTLDPYTPPSTPGTYTVTYTINQDQEDANPGNNSATRTFAISDGEFARDGGALSAFVNLGLDEYWGGNGFYFTEAGSIHCIGGALFNDSEIGAFFDFELRAFSATGLDFVANTDLGTVTQSMLNGSGGNNFTYLWIETGAVPVFPGDEYVPMFHHFGGAEPVYVGINGTSPDFSSYVIAEFETQSCAPCYTTSTYMVRIGMSEEFCESMIEEVEEPNSVASLEKVSIYELFPNPTRGITTVEYSLLDNSRVVMFMFDMNGRIVYSNDLGVVGAGDYRHELNFSNLAAGTYTFSIKVNDKHETKQVMIR
ncbi:MAG: T9SS C-terminal target domain-containing protein [Cryomorphaceae bacterium]|nr:MAG: T9SS C-terminal target domain-containing protein [Cryomorphaceae bacterium]